ncbi:MAG: hypothetical protein ACOX9A_06685 [Anaerolineae bacterium]|jgi:tRNA nucleotidyltransferase/poly(A) polymerase
MSADIERDPRRAVETWIDEEPFRRRVVEYVGAHSAEVYLVGGTVRDALLRRAGCDLDFAVSDRAIDLAREVADLLGAAYVAMDEAHDVGRVVVRLHGRTHHIDFAGYRAADIDSDLRARDFTVNAMAVAVEPNGLGAFLDPTGGRDDLSLGLLRAAYAGAFFDDPVRILRGVRLRGSLGLMWTAETEALAQEALAGLGNVSPERARDELAQILDLDDAAGTLRYAATLGVPGMVIPDLSDANRLERGISLVEALVETRARLESDSDLGRYSRALAAHLNAPMPGGRPLRISLWLAAMLVGVDGPERAGKIARGLRLSAAEVRHVGRAVGAREHLAAADRGAGCDTLWAHRYFRRAGAAGVCGALLALADDVIESVEAACLLSAWFEAHERLVDPPLLLNGREVMDLLGVAQGPMVGRLLDALREAQVTGDVSTRQEAERFLRAIARYD